MPISTSRTRCSRRCPGSSGTIRILGIDPGLSATGYGVIEKDHAVDFGVITTDNTQPTGVRLKRLADKLTEVISENRPQRCAIETLFFKTGGARSVILSAQCRGVLLYVLAVHGIPTVEVTPATIKLAVTGSGKASKKQMNYMMSQLLGLGDDIQEHEADALAAAFCLARRTLAKR
ncbi:MAG: crossover junction endodeoxyribonuclease RuvC [candidate division WOR-3 bacterium]|nr:MAG: crossover junction endodeoxyribonuclease RuvC [candidate division WOR-3 bacterium]